VLEYLNSSVGAVHHRNEIKIEGEKIVNKWRELK
jgi:hypothetical protein